jgi:hypothetical protein
LRDILMQAMMSKPDRHHLHEPGSE